MARGLRKWSKTALNNGTADGGVNWQEGMAPSAVNDSARAEMASMAMWRDDNNGSLAGTLSTATYSVTSNQTFDAYTAGDTIAFQISADMPATALLNVDTLGAKPLRPTPGVEFVGGEFKANQVVRATYFSSNSGEWVVSNDPQGANNFTVAGKLSLTSTADMLLPGGTTGQQPSAEAGGFRYNSTKVAPEFSDGTNWLALLYTLSGAQLPYGGAFNATITESHSGNAVTFNLKTLAGNDPSASDPVLLTFRNSTIATGNYVYRTVTSALSLTISSGSLMGASNNTAFKLWLVLFDDAGTIKLGAINCASGTSVYPLGQVPLASSTADDGLGGSDSAQTFYTKNGVAAVSSKSYVILGYVSYESGLSTAGNWAASPTRIQLYGAGVPLPGQTVQHYGQQVTATQNTSNNYSLSGTAPVAANGASYASIAMAASSAANKIRIRGAAYGSASTSSAVFTAFVTSSSGPTTLSACYNGPLFAGGLTMTPAPFFYEGSAGSTSSITYTAYFSTNTGTAYLNSTSTTTNNLGGTAASFLEVEEIMT